MIGIEGYGRYNDDPTCVGCPRAKSDMTPCVARDGALAAADDGPCVGCGEQPADLLKAIVWAATEPTAAGGVSNEGEPTRGVADERNEQ